MPELPEVETVRRQLEPVIRGRRIAALEVLDPRWCAPLSGGDLSSASRGRRIEALERRGKYLILRLEGDRALVMHLRMTGNLVFADDDDEEPPHLRARIRLEAGGGELRFTDMRRFGHAVLLEGEEVQRYLDERLGVEPLSEAFTAEELGRRAAGRTAPLKSFLLSQARIAGIGNIYADEALHRARLHPLSPAGSMRPEHLDRLREGIVAALEAGLDNGGATISDYRDARGLSGAMQDEFLVHRREGLPCPRCAQPIRRIVVTGRSTYYCTGCQQRLRRRRRPAQKRGAAR